ncbi:MAG: hypothetical protein RR789_03190 [Clostridium sp.]
MRKIILGLILALLSLMLYGCSDNKEANNEGVDVAKYEVSNINDISIDSQMYTYNVIVNHEVSKKGLDVYAKEILEKAKKDKPFKSIQILFYDGKYAEGVGAMPPLGKYIFAPEGDFSKGVLVSPGEYDKMTEVNNLKEVNWKLKPSENDQKIVEAYNQFFIEESEKRPNDIVRDSEVKENLAKYMEVSVDEINKALTNVDKWIWQE